MIYRARKIDENIDVAIKIYNTRFEEDLNLQSRLNFSNDSKFLALNIEVFRYVDYQRKPRLSVVMELAQGDLFDFSTTLEAAKYKEKQWRHVFQSLATAVSILHKARIIHRDIKPRNVLLFREGNDLRAKLCDFGLAIDENAPKLPKGTPTFMAPEIFNLDYSFPVDMFSLGLTFWSSLIADPTLSIVRRTLRVLYIGADNVNSLPTLVQSSLDHRGNGWAVSIIDRLLDFNETRRIKASGILSII